MNNSELTPILHFDKSKGIKYANNIPYMDEEDYKYIDRMQKKTSQIAEECRLQSNANAKDLKAHQKKYEILEVTFQRLKTEHDETIKLYVKKFKYYEEKFDVEFSQIRKEITEGNHLLNHDFNSPPIQIDVDFHMNKLNESKKYLSLCRRDLRNLAISEKISKVLYYLGLGLVIHFSGLLIVYSGLLAKNGCSHVVMFAIKAVNLTRNRNTGGEM